MMDITWGGFEWDSKKNKSNITKHGISFKDAIAVSEEPYLKIVSDRSGEKRSLALGRAQGRIIAVIYTEQQGRIRVISARAARTYEREIYHTRVGDTS